MNFYFAPMEGITGYSYRNAQHALFGRAGKYFTPFLSPGQNRCMNARERNDILPEHNEGIPLVPQILTNQAENAIHACRILQEEYGYNEVNLNLGCPSGTVAAKQKGAGFLAVPDRLDDFLDRVYSRIQIKLSIKTRLGTGQPEEFFRLMEIYGKYPVSELIIHPRVQKDFYKNSPRLAIFREAVKTLPMPVCYNGDLFTLSDIAGFSEEFPRIHTVMIGRGLIVNPGLLDCYNGGALTKERLRQFHDVLCRDYQSILSGDKNILFRMKELWFYMIRLFPGSEKTAKKLKKAQRLKEYLEAVDTLFAEYELVVPQHLAF